MEQKKLLDFCSIWHFFLPTTSLKHEYCKKVKNVYLMFILTVFNKKNMKKFISTFLQKKQKCNNKLNCKNVSKFVFLESGFCMRYCCGKNRGFLMHITDNSKQVSKLFL